MTLIRDAIACAAQGLAVFPLRPGTKAPLTLHGFHDASTNLKVVQGWWRRWPDAGIGLATGIVSGVVLLDVDIKKVDGEASLRFLVRKNGELPTGPVARTGSGGRQIYFDYPGGHVPRVIGFRPGLDLLGNNGYGILPSTLHPNGKRYAWIFPFSRETLRPLPPWLLEAALEGQERTAPVATDDGPIPEGMRAVTLFKIGCRYRAVGLEEEEILAVLRVDNEARCRPPLDDTEVRHAANEAAKYPPGTQPAHQADDIHDGVLAALREAPT